MEILVPIQTSDTANQRFWGQWFVEYKGRQSGNGLLSINRYGTNGGYVALYQNKNPETNTPDMITKGRFSFSSYSDSAFHAVAISFGSSNQVSITASPVSGRNAESWFGKWHSTDAYSGEFTMFKLQPRLSQQNIAVAENWNDFSEWAFSKASQSAVFRGLGDATFALESTAHRAGIFDLHHYLFEVIPRVRAELLKRHGIRLNIAAADELAELLALVRHHGFPSPIMDWSKSPWVALYFASAAAKELLQRNREVKTLRVYCLGHDGISVTANVSDTLLAPSINGKLIEIPTPMTARVTAQEGVFLLTPCVDIVSSVNHAEDVQRRVMLDAIDLDPKLLREIDRRLDQMMINEATMMANVDSTLSYLSRNLFE